MDSHVVDPNSHIVKCPECQDVRETGIGCIHCGDMTYSDGGPRQCVDTGCAFFAIDQPELVADPEQVTPPSTNKLDGDKYTVDAPEVVTMPAEVYAVIARIATRSKKPLSKIPTPTQLLKRAIKNSREPAEGDCRYCRCEQGSGPDGADCYSDCPMEAARALVNRP